MRSSSLPNGVSCSGNRFISCLNAFWVLTAAGYVLQRRAKELLRNPFFLYFVLAESVLLLTVGKPGVLDQFTSPSPLWRESCGSSRWLRHC